MLLIYLLLFTYGCGPYAIKRSIKYALKPWDQNFVYSLIRKRYNNKRSEKRVPEGFLCEKLHILLTEGTSGSCGELGVESVCHLGPDHLLGYCERHATRLREGVVPRHGGPGVRLLVAVHNHHHWQRQCPHLNSLLCHSLSRKQYPKSKALGPIKIYYFFM